MGPWPIKVNQQHPLHMHFQHTTTRADKVSQTRSLLPTNQMQPSQTHEKFWWVSYGGTKAEPHLKTNYIFFQLSETKSTLKPNKFPIKTSPQMGPWPIKINQQHPLHMHFQHTTTRADKVSQTRSLLPTNQMQPSQTHEKFWWVSYGGTKAE